jgi:hypothetical protein
MRWVEERRSREAAFQHQFGWHGGWNADLPNCPCSGSSRPLIAKLRIGEVVLTAGIGQVVLQIRRLVLATRVTLAKQETKL